ncbi:hypothetical protein TWF506_005907 [Arthrobotrys conoides]|uniref:F-box domain-containing protein n=1 Tax=Arthrobotrys conoides TaxID=74498 RepID=A0AAN8NK38_9PEZI
MPTLPPEIELQVLEFAFTDWLEQPTLCAVCPLWRDYIETSPAAFLARYDSSIVLGGTAAISASPRPQFHRIIGYRKLLFQSKSAPYKLLPCTTEQDQQGRVRVLTERDLSMFFNDPVIKPTGYPLNLYTPIITPIVGAAFSFTNINGLRNKIEQHWNPGNGTVGSFLGRFKEHVDSILDVDEREGAYEGTRLFGVMFTIDRTWYDKVGYGLGMNICPLAVLT